MGVRANDEAIDALLREVLSHHVEPSVEAEHPNYSIRIEARSADGHPVGEALHSAYEGGCVLARDRSPGVVVATLLRHLDQHADTAGTTPAVSAVVLRRRDGSVVLVSASARRWAARRRRWLRAKGLELLPTPVVWIDEVTGEATVPALGLPVDLAPLGGSGTIDPALLALGDVHRGRVAAWVLASVEGAFEPIPRARAVEAARHAVRREGASGAPGVVTALSRAMRSATTVGAGTLHRPEIVDHLPQLA